MLLNSGALRSGKVRGASGHRQPIVTPVTRVDRGLFVRARPVIDRAAGIQFSRIWPTPRLLSGEIVEEYQHSIIQSFMAALFVPLDSGFVSQREPNKLTLHHCHGWTIYGGKLSTTSIDGPAVAAAGGRGAAFCD